MKLNLASGTDLRPPPWVNLDIVRQWPGFRPCDVLWDARKDTIPFPDASVDEVCAGYLLLHIAPQYHDPVMREIARVMAPGAKLQVGEVEMDEALRRWLHNPRDKSANEMIWGEQGQHDGHPELLPFEDADKHCCGFTEATLRELLVKHGFHNIHRVKIHAPEVWYELTLECYR